MSAEFDAGGPLAAPLDLRVIDRVAVMTLNRPDAMNSFDPEMFTAFKQAWHRIATDDAILVTIISAAGDKAFSTGSDLKKTMPPPGPGSPQAYSRPASQPY